MIARTGKMPARHAIILAVFLACAIVLGGGGSLNPGTEILLEIAFAAVALAWVWIGLADGVLPHPQSRLVWLIGALVLAVPVVQLIPLPPGLWSRLGWQEDRLAALDLVGDAHHWQTWTHAPAQTMASLLAMIPAVAVFVTTASLGGRGRSIVVGVIVAGALVTALLGAVQVSMGLSSFNLYREHHSGVVTGFFANRNAAADFLLIGLAASAAFFMPPLLAARGRGTNALRGRQSVGITFAGVMVVLLFATVLTGSRTGIALIPVALLAAAFILRPVLADFGRWRMLPLLTALGVGLLVVLAAVAGQTTLAGVGARFSFTGELRPELWQDAWFALQRAWPFGIGMGGAQSALIAVERLEILDPAIPNRVHNDYLELGLEAGALGAVVLACIAVLVAVLALRAWRQRPEHRHLTVLGLAILVILGVHSFVDYPLRSMALACLIGTGAGLLVAAPRTLAQTSEAVVGSDT